MENFGFGTLDGPAIFIKNPTNLLKLLRNFGHIITNLGVNFSQLNDNLCTEIENYLAEYCGNSLQRYTLICRTTKIPFEYLPKPMKNITFLRINTLWNQKIDHIQFLNETNLPNVRKILIYGNGNQLPDSKKIHYENIEHFTICVHDEEKFPFSFGNLKHLILSGAIHLNDEFFECIGSLKKLQTLKIFRFSLEFKSSDSFGKLLQLPNILSNIVEMQFECRYFMSSDPILQFLKQSRKLRRLSLHFENDNTLLHTEYVIRSNILQTITSNLTMEWTFRTINPYCLLPYSRLEQVCYVIEKTTD